MYKLYVCTHESRGSLCDVKQSHSTIYSETIFMLGTKAMMNLITPMVTGQVVDSQWL